MINQDQRKLMKSKNHSTNYISHFRSINEITSDKETIDCHDEILSDLKDLDSFH